MGLLITFEGCEGCGKSTQAERLHKRMMQAGVPCLRTYEPGGTKLGERLRDLLKHQHEIGLSPSAELFLFLAARAQLTTEVIQPGMRAGVVICDRPGNHICRLASGLKMREDGEVQEQACLLLSNG